MTNGSDLTRRVHEDLVSQPALSNTQIEVGEAEGVVSLTGVVPSYGHKLIARELAGRVPGVSGVRNDLVVRIPAGARREDREIEEIIERVLAWNTAVAPQRIRVSVEDGHVTLAGEVDWPFQKQAAEAAVVPLVGVQSVGNLLSVRPRGLVDRVEEKIRQALHRNADIDADRIRVTVDGGKVVLRGVVRSWSEVEAAEAAAWVAQGVGEVESHLRTDEELVRA
jgi:osmotically-inducible protein OsmY